MSQLGPSTPKSSWPQSQQKQVHVLYRSSVFAGHELSPKRISPQKSRIDSIMKIHPPTTATGVRSFLCMTNFCKQYIPNYSTITSTLRLLTKKNRRFTWDSAQSAFDQLKSSLVSAPVMAFYNQMQTLN